MQLIFYGFIRLLEFNHRKDFEDFRKDPKDFIKEKLAVHLHFLKTHLINLSKPSIFLMILTNLNELLCLI